MAQKLAEYDHEIPQSLQTTDSKHRKDEAQNTNSQMTARTYKIKAPSSLFFGKTIGKQEISLSTILQNKDQSQLQTNGRNNKL